MLALHRALSVYNMLNDRIEWFHFAPLRLTLRSVAKKPLDRLDRSLVCFHRQPNTEKRLGRKVVFPGLRKPVQAALILSLGRWRTYPDKPLADEPLKSMGQFTMRVLVLSQSERLRPFPSPAPRQTGARLRARPRWPVQER